MWRSETAISTEVVKVVVVLVVDLADLADLVIHPPYPDLADLVIHPPTPSMKERRHSFSERLLNIESQ